MHKIKTLLMFVLPLLLVLGYSYSVVGLEKPPDIKTAAQLTPNISEPEPHVDIEVHEDGFVPAVGNEANNLSFEIERVSAKVAPESVNNVKHKGVKSSILAEGFEGGVIPPTGWSVIVNNPYTWYASTSAYEGTYSAQCDYDDTYSGTQDEWMVSPVMDFTMYSGSDLRLEFAWMASYYWSVDPYNNYNLEVWISTDGGTNFSTMLWSEDGEGVFTNWTWYTENISLTAYAAETNVALGFRYYGYDGAQGNFDAISVNDDPPPTGRCCYGEPTAPSCADMMEADCEATGEMLSWDADLNCTDNPCPAAGPGDNCNNPLLLTVPADLPYTDANEYTCGRGDDYGSADMCYTYGYGDGEDIVYEMTVTAETDVIMTMNPKGATWTYVEVRTECPPPNGTCMFYFRSTAGDPYNSGVQTLPAGTYYIIVDTWPDPYCLDDFDLTIEEFTGGGEGDNCDTPIEVKVPGDLPYNDIGNYTCGRLNDYDATCLGYYDGGEDIIYWLDVDVETMIDITMDPKTTNYTGMSVDETCPAGGEGECIAYATVGYSGGILQILGLTLAPGSYYIMIDTWPSPDCIPEFDLHISENTGLGRCCYGDPGAPSCDDLTEGDCDATGSMLSWDMGLNCTDNPCPVLSLGDNCSVPIELKIPEDLTFEDNNYTCGRLDDYDATCMGSYDGGEDIIYSFDVDTETKLVLTLDPMGTTYTGMGISDVCPLDATTCIAYAYNSSSGTYQMEVTLTPGYYYLMIDTYPSPDCIPEFYLKIEEDTCTPPPNDHCEDVTPVALPMETLVTINGDNTCSSGDDCTLLSDNGHAWEAFTITEKADIVMDYCGTTPAFELIYRVLADACPCDAGSGELIFGETDWDLCGDGNVTVYFSAVEPGTYYIPVLSSHPDYPSYYYEGPYTINLYATTWIPHYCEAYSTSCFEYIENVNCGGIDNTSDCENYADFTAQVAYMAYEGDYPITVTIGNAYSSDYVMVWCDWNQDFDFEDAGEQIAITGNPGYGPMTGTVTPPADAVAGMTRMRVRLNDGSDPGPCGSTSYGEVEDYSIFVGGTPSTLTMDPDPVDFGTVPEGSTGTLPWTLGAVGDFDINFSIEVEYMKFASRPGGNSMLTNIKPDKLPPDNSPAPDPNPNVTKQGGDNIGSAVAITMPYSNTGTTVGYTNDYDEVCPYSGSTAPDVVYSYTPSSDEALDVDMYGSSYDTKIYIYENDVSTLVACNDDYYSDYTSALFDVPISAGNTYYIVIDGYGTYAGDYVINADAGPLFVFECPPGATSESEACGDDTNGGCNSTPAVFEPINCGDTVCGTAWADGTTRDTDWFLFEMFQTGPITITGQANFPVIFGFVDTADCNLASALDPYALGNPGDIVSASRTAGPGIYWAFVANQTWDNVMPCGTTNDYWMTLECEAGTAPILWLDPVPDNGTIPSNGTFEVALNYDCTGMSQGMHYANLVVHHTGAKGVDICPAQIMVGGGNEIVTIDPNPMSAAMAYTLGDSAHVVIRLGGEFADGGHTVDEVDGGTIMINGVAPESVEILPSHSDFTGEVFEMLIKGSDFLGTYPLFWDTDTYTYSVTGDWLAGGSFQQDGEVVVVGHRSGDANFDHVINIFDATYIISYLYLGGPSPLPIIETGDADANGAINLLDVTRIISFLYLNGPAPSHQ
jgi:hypothetical protein